MTCLSPHLRIALLQLPSRAHIRKEKAKIAEGIRATRKAASAANSAGADSEPTPSKAGTPCGPLLALPASSLAAEEVLDLLRCGGCGSKEHVSLSCGYYAALSWWQKSSQLDIPCKLPSSSLLPPGSGPRATSPWRRGAAGSPGPCTSAARPTGRCLTEHTACSVCQTLCMQVWI